MKRSLMIPVMILAGICALSGCKAKEKIDLNSIHTTAAATDAPAKETMAPTTAAPSKEDGGNDSSSKPSQSSTTARLDTYTSGKVSIEYPIVTKLSNSEKEASVNELLKSNALSYIQSNSVNESKDSLNIKCKVISIDRSRITAVYSGDYTASGAASPVSIYYTNTVDLGKGTDVSFSEYADAYTMAGYVLSDDCKFYNVSSELEKELLSYKNTQTMEYYTQLFNNADFPFKASGSKSAFPQSFSYEKQGVIYYSIPVSHALGDYAVITFTPDSK